MFKTVFSLLASALVLAACAQPQTQTAAPPPPAAPSLPQAYAVFFNTDQSALSPDAAATVSQAAAAFKQGGTAVGVRGHADTVGNAEYNLQLSWRRAAAVKAALQSNGVPASAILSGAVGEQNLPVATADQVPERLNRSVSIIISKQQALMSDADYCQALSVAYRRYRVNQAASGTAARAMGVCQTDPASGIPVLEDTLTGMNVPLPSRVLARS